MAKKRKDPSKIREDANETAFRILQEAIGEQPKTSPPSSRSENQKNPTAVQRGQKGGKRGGKRRADSLSPEMRSEIARKAARARWSDS